MLSVWLARAPLALLIVAAASGVGGLVALGWYGDETAGFVSAGLAGLLALGVLVLRDGWRGQQLMAWLRSAQTTPAPRDTGFWGELGYRVERALRTNDLQLRQEQLRLAQFLRAIDASPNGVLMLDQAEQIEWCNSLAAEHFGLDPERDRRQRVTNLVRAPAFVTYLQSGQFDEPVIFNGPASAAGGGARSLLSVLVRPYGDGMKLVLSQDITLRERAEAMRRDFVANVSHEIRTPLTVLSGFVETMNTLPLKEAERSHVLGLMQQQTDRMQALVADLLTLARLEGSPRPAPDRWVAVADVMRQAVADALALSAGRHQIDASGGDDAEIAGSQTELFSAIANLLNNAVRYTPADGRIGLQWAWRADGGGELSVSDTGIGIAREHVPRLTERFYRVDGSRSRDTGGTGLGLSIVKHVAQRHGGEIDVHSEPGKGSTFKLVLPALRVRRRPAQGAWSAPAAAAVHQVH